MERAALWAICALGCAEVTLEDPPSQLGRGPSGPGGASAVSPSPSVPGGVTPAAPADTSPASSAPPASGSPSTSVGANPPAVRPPMMPPSVPPPIASSGESGDVLFADDFEDGDDAGWIADVADGDDRVGDWKVVTTDEGHAYAQLDTSSSDESWSVGGDIDWTDVSFDVRFRFTDASSTQDAIVMLGVRFQDKDNYYFLEYGGDGDIEVRKRVDGSQSELQSDELDRAAVAGEWIEVTFTARGDSLEAQVDGERVGSTVLDGDLASGGIALGVRENAAVEFDDVRVTVP